MSRAVDHLDAPSESLTSPEHTYHCHNYFTRGQSLPRKVTWEKFQTIEGFALGACNLAKRDALQTGTNRTDLATSILTDLNIIKPSALMLLDELISLVGVSGYNALNDSAPSRPVVIDYLMDCRLLRE